MAPQNSFIQSFIIYKSGLPSQLLQSVLIFAWGPLEGQGKAFEDANQYLNILEKEIEGKKFFGGEQIGLVDLVAGFIAHWIGMIEEATGKELLVQEKYPCLLQWAKEFTSCNIIKENLPQRDPLVALFKQRVEAVRAAN